jgi:antitoxin MazE
MDVSVIQIGNSKGIRLSKYLLERYNIKGSVELVLEKGYFIVKPKALPRKGWEKAFKKLNETRDDKALMPDFFEDETFDEWM